MCPSSAPKKNRNYKLTNSIREDHGQPVWCVAFNFVGESNHDIFASCGAAQATIYQCLPGGKVDILQAYRDEDENEEFYACKWSVNVRTGAPLLLLAGKRGLLKALNCETEELSMCAEGHGDAINDISVHPIRPSLVLTASRDSALRLWNIETNVCVLLMHGDGGHLNEVLSIDFHPYHGEQFLSAGMDNTVKIWSLKDMQEHIENSFTYEASKGKVFHTRQLPCPVFSSHKVHFNYVDCVRWMGDLILSKSVNNRIFLWQKDAKDDVSGMKGLVHLLHGACTLSHCRSAARKEQEMVQASDGSVMWLTRDDTHGCTCVLHTEMELEDAHVWFVRFALDKQCRTLACGTRSGHVFVWDPQDLEAKPAAKLRRDAGVKTTVRQTAVSADGNTIVSCCDDATIWRWDVQST